YALGFPRPLVDRVAKALETYDSVMVRRDLEADGGFADFFRRPGEADLAASGAGRAPAEDAVRGSAAMTGARGLTDGVGQPNHARGGGLGGASGAERGDGRLARPEDARRLQDVGPGQDPLGPIAPLSDPGDPPVGAELVDSLGQVNKRMPLVGKVPPWK